MSADNSTESTVSNKPSKPSPDFPLTPHPSGRWCKKIKGKTFYFGKWADPEGAFHLFQDFQAGKPLRAKKSRRRDSHQHAKPYDDFPLTAHPSGRWCKKILGKIHYFGAVADPQAALNEFNRVKEDLYAGRTPREHLPEGGTLRELVISYLQHKQNMVNTGEVSPRTFADCHRICRSLTEYFGKTKVVAELHQDDFAGYRNALAKNMGPVSLGNIIQRTRSVFKFAIENGFIEKPVLFGPGFKRPSKKTLRLERAKQGPKLFAAEEVRQLLGVAGVPLTAMILLACNGALGNSDIANMPQSAVDLKTGWVDYPRPKTGIARKFPLWPETLDALKAALAKRPTPKDKAHAGLIFVTKYGSTWAKTIFEKRQPTEGEEDDQVTLYRSNFDNEVSKEFNKLFAEAKLQRKKGRSFYTLRHVFETVAGESRDQVAVDHVMGHARDDMASVYREKVSDDRLQRVVDTVRAWLFPAQEDGNDRAIAGKVG